MLKLFLWLRYLHKKRIAFLSIVAVALSVTLMVVVNSLFEGYIQALRQMVTGQFGELTLNVFSDIPDYDEFLDRLEQIDGIKAAAPWSYGSGLLYLEGGDVRAVSVEGIKANREKEFGYWFNNLLRQKNSEKELNFNIPGDNNALGIWLGINVVADPDEETDKYDFEQVKKYIGKEAKLITIAGEKRKVIKLKVSDIVSSQDFFRDKTLYLPFDEYRRIVNLDKQKNKLHQIKVKLTDNINLKTIENQIRSIWQQYTIEKFNDDSKEIPRIEIFNREKSLGRIFEDLQNQMSVVLFVFSIICSVAVLLIFCIFYMIVTAKQKDIAIIKSCGASSSSAAMIFTGFGICVGLVGSALGVVFGYVITKNINVLEEWVRIIFGIKLWRTSSYGLAVIPHQVNWPAVPVIVAAAIIGCIVGVLIPAIIAARTKPVEILRYE